MALAEELALAELPREDLERARRSYEAYARTVGIVPRWETLPTRLQLGWVAASRIAREAPGATPVAPGTAAGDLRCG